MTTPEPLLSATDFASFKAGDENWFLSAVGRGIREYCGWHIAPVQTETVDVHVGSTGLIWLPTHRVVSVTSLGRDGWIVDPSRYSVRESGAIQLHRCHLIDSPSVAPQGFWLQRGRRLTCVMNHGYDTLPEDVAQVGYELAMRVMEKPAGVVKSLEAGPYRFGFAPFGSYLDDSQKDRLGPYMLQRF